MKSGLRHELELDSSQFRVAFLVGPPTLTASGCLSLGWLRDTSRALSHWCRCALTHLMAGDRFS